MIVLDIKKTGGEIRGRLFLFIDKILSGYLLKVLSLRLNENFYMRLSDRDLVPVLEIDFISPVGGLFYAFSRRNLSTR